MAPASDGIRTPRFWQSLVAELIGSFIYTLIGCGSWIQTRTDAPPDRVRICIAFGLTYTALVYSFRHISGGHINPVITISHLVSRKMQVVIGVVYILMQCLGAVIGAALVYGFTPDEHRDNLGATKVDAGMSAEQGLGVEFFATFLYVFVAQASRDQEDKLEIVKATSPFLMGLVLIAAMIFAFPFTGGSLNPARSFGPAIVRGVWDNHWVYWFGPILGAIGGAVLYDFLFASDAQVARIKSFKLDRDGFHARKASPHRSAHGHVDNLPPEEVALRSGSHSKSPSPERLIRTSTTPERHPRDVEEGGIKVEGDGKEPKVISDV